MKKITEKRVELVKDLMVKIPENAEVVSFGETTYCKFNVNKYKFRFKMYKNSSEQYCLFNIVQKVTKDEETGEYSPVKTHIFCRQMDKQFKPVIVLRNKKITTGLAFMMKEYGFGCVEGIKEELDKLIVPIARCPLNLNKRNVADIKRQKIFDLYEREEHMKFWVEIDQNGEITHFFQKLEPSKPDMVFCQVSNQEAMARTFARILAMDLRFRSKHWILDENVDEELVEGWIRINKKYSDSEYINMRLSNEDD